MLSLFAQNVSLNAGNPFVNLGRNHQDREVVVEEPVQVDESQNEAGTYNL